MNKSDNLNYISVQPDSHFLPHSIPSATLYGTAKRTPGIATITCYTSHGVVLCIARQDIHINRTEKQQARFIARRAFISYNPTI
jgi:hypothetical protein